MAAQKPKTGQEKADGIVKKALRLAAFSAAAAIITGNVCGIFTQTAFLKTSFALRQTARTSANKNIQDVFAVVETTYPSNVLVYGNRLLASFPKQLNFVGAMKNLPAREEFKTAAGCLTCLPIKAIPFEKGDTFGDNSRQKVGLNRHDFRLIVFTEDRFMEGKDDKPTVYVDKAALARLMPNATATERFVKHTMEAAEGACRYACGTPKGPEEKKEETLGIGTRISASVKEFPGKVWDFFHKDSNKKKEGDAPFTPAKEITPSTPPAKNAPTIKTFAVPKP